MGQYIAERQAYACDFRVIADISVTVRRYELQLLLQELNGVKTSFINRFYFLVLVSNALVSQCSELSALVFAEMRVSLSDIA